MGQEKFRRKTTAVGLLDARGGLYSRGVPVFGSPGMMTSGTAYHVSSTASNASDSNSGLTPDQPLATIDAAINKCTANKGDLVVIHENHAETILTDAAIDCDVAGISIVGLGQGASRPTITMGATATGASTAATVEINAANVRLENLLFLAGIDSLVKAVHVIGDDFSLVNCEFREASGKQMLIAVNIGAANNDADRGKYYGNKFTSITAGATSAISLTQLQDAVEIVGNTIYGDYSDAGIQNPTGEICTNLLIADNVVSNLSSGNHAIQLVSACTGAAVGNRLYGDTLADIFDPGSLKCNDNIGVDAIDQAGVAVPTTAAGGLGIGAIGTDTFQAGAIDAAAIGVGAIAADAFAAGAIDAAAIAVGAIAADAFAAGAIDAAAIGVGAIAADAFAAGAIDAAAIGVGAIAADAFAAGAIDAAAIAVGAIAADAFAAGAIDAAAIAAGAIDAATFAAGAIDAAAIATGAVDADAIAADTILGADNNNNAFASTNVVSNVDGSLIERLEHLAQVSTAGAAAATSNPLLGLKVTKATADVFTGAEAALFTVSGGRVLVTHLEGEVTTQIQAGAQNFKLQSNPTVGTTTDLCANLDIDADEVGTLYTIAGAAATALQRGESGSVPGMSVRGVVVPEGQIVALSAGNVTGSAQFELWYFPLDAGAAVASA